MEVSSPHTTVRDEEIWNKYNEAAIKRNRPEKKTKMGIPHHQQAAPGRVVYLLRTAIKRLQGKLAVIASISNPTVLKATKKG